jgi:hypothetical protein
MGRTVLNQNYVKRDGTIDTKGRVNIYMPVFGPFQVLIRHLIFTSDLRWFKITIAYDICPLMVNSISCEVVFGLVNWCCLAISDGFHEIISKWQHISDRQLLTMRIEITWTTLCDTDSMLSCNTARFSVKANIILSEYNKGNKKKTTEIDLIHMIVL